MNSLSKAKKVKKPKKSEKTRLEEIAEEIRNLPYLEDRVGQAFIMFRNGSKNNYTSEKDL